MLNIRATVRTTSSLCTTKSLFVSVPHHFQFSLSLGHLGHYGDMPLSAQQTQIPHGDVWSGCISHIDKGDVMEASRLSVLAGGAVTAATIWSVNTHPGSSTVYTGKGRKALSGPGFMILRAPVSTWLAHTQQRSTISRMGVSGGTLSRCRRKV